MAVSQPILLRAEDGSAYVRVKPFKIPDADTTYVPEDGELCVFQDRLYVGDGTTIHGIAAGLDDSNYAKLNQANTFGSPMSIVRTSPGVASFTMGSLNGGGLIYIDGRQGLGSGGLLSLGPYNASSLAGQILWTDTGNGHWTVNPHAVSVYCKGTLFVVAYNNGSITKYRWMDLSSTNANWNYSTTAP